MVLPVISLEIVLEGFKFEKNTCGLYRTISQQHVSKD